MSKAIIIEYDSEEDEQTIREESPPREKKRKLTEQEMYEITDFLQVDPEKDWETSMAVMEENRNDLFEQLKNIEIYPSKIPKLKLGIQNDYHTSKIEPGTAIGCDSSLAIGEPTTQMSSLTTTKVVLRQGNKTLNTTMGEFIDSEIKKAWMIMVDDNDSEIVPIDVFETTEIMSISKDEKVHWNKITELSRHPVNGDLVRIKTESGRETVCTLSHSFLTRDINGVVPILGSDIEIGHRVPVFFRTPEVENPTSEIELWNDNKTSLDRSFGEFIGIYIAEGSTCRSNTNISISTTQKYYKDLSQEVLLHLTNKNIKTHISKPHKIQDSKKEYSGEDHTVSHKRLSQWLRNNIGTYSHNKEIPSFVYGCTKEFIGSVLRAMFDGDGNFHGNRKSIKYHTTSSELIQQVAFLLSYFGIFSTYQIEKEACDKHKALWVLLIFGPKYGKIFHDQIGTNNEKNRLELQSYIDDKDGRNFIDQVPNCAELVSKIGRGLKLPGASRNYGRWVKKESEGYCIGKNTLSEYVKLFTEKNEEKNGDFEDDIALLQQAIDADVIWDKVVEVEIIKADPSDKVYDFSVSVDETFATQSGILVHNTLNTFHLAGVSSANVTLGVPRTNEILNASKNQKTNVLQISLLPTSTDLTNLQMVRDKCRSLFEERYVDQCITKHEILNKKYDSLSSEDQIWYDLFDTFYSTHYRNCDWCIRLTLNKLIMYQYKLTTEKIAERIEEEYKDCRCVFSPDETGIVDIYIDTSNVDTPGVILATKKKAGKRGKKDDDDDDRKKKGKTDDDTPAPPPPRILINDDNKDYYFVSRVALDYILDIKLNGVEGITKVYYQLDNKTKTWKIETEGTNMREVMNNPEVDFRHVVSNNMWEIFGILGIEAARKFLVTEISMTISFGGTFIDPVHPALLADSMTSTGTITSVNRYGISKSVVGVLTPASFEQSHQNMLDAPAKGVTDDLSTVSAGIITAKHVRIGTGYFGLITDRKKLKGMTIPKPLPKIMEEVNNIPEDSRFPTSNAVFKNGGVGKVIEREISKDVVPPMEYEDF